MLLALSSAGDVVESVVALGLPLAVLPVCQLSELIEPTSSPLAGRPGPPGSGNDVSLRVQRLTAEVGRPDATHPGRNPSERAHLTVSATLTGVL